MVPSGLTEYSMRLPLTISVMTSVSTTAASSTPSGSCSRTLVRLITWSWPCSTKSMSSSSMTGTSWSRIAMMSASSR
ncbi:hypothetical protein ACFFX0_19150 [Citricoccus parietis]|uniref:Uncharacterized protein n=1 Tax=Citricoccus parietis TaxID=592307 RepID=A0ABV5G2P4_9MICC